jgi:hypothetical protein
MPFLKKNAPTLEPVDYRILTAALDLIVERGFHNVLVHKKKGVGLKKVKVKERDLQMADPFVCWTWVFLISVVMKY